jgi:hypothetical protein
LGIPERISESDKRLHGPQNAIGRIREWGMVRHEEPPNAFPASPFARIAEMREFAGARSENKCDMVMEEGDTEATPCKPDGGMAAFYGRNLASLDRHVRCRETAQAIASLPEDLRIVVRTMYTVPQRERPKSDRIVAELLGLTRLEVIKRLERAYGWVGRDLGLPPI